MGQFSMEISGHAGSVLSGNQHSSCNSAITSPQALDLSVVGYYLRINLRFATASAAWYKTSHNARRSHSQNIGDIHEAQAMIVRPLNLCSCLQICLLGNLDCLVTDMGSPTYIG